MDNEPHPLGVNEFRSRVVGDAVYVEPDRESINARIAFHKANRTPWYKDAWQRAIAIPITDYEYVGMKMYIELNK